MSAQTTPPWQQAARRLRYGASATMRISDAERAEVADLLAKHYSDGRLDQAEFEQRMDLAMHAKTYGDLSGLFADLPQPDQPAQQGAPAAPAPRRRNGRRRHPVLLIALIVVIAILAGRVLAFTLAPWAWFGPWPLIALIAVLVVYAARRRRSQP